MYDDDYDAQPIWLVEYYGGATGTACSHTVRGTYAYALAWAKRVIKGEFYITRY